MSFFFDIENSRVMNQSFMLVFRLLLVASCFRWHSLAAAEPKAANDAAGIEFFEQRIRPVLVAHCYECHSAEAARRGKLKAGLALDTRDGLLQGGESGPAVVPGKPGESLLVAALRFDGLEMPPEKPLSPEIITDFETWVARGAPDPRSGGAARVERGLSIDDGRRFWSFQSPRKRVAPRVHRADWPLEELDQFVLAKQEELGLSTLGSASPRVLIRRLFFDLIGLPPKPDEVEAFVDATCAAAEAARSPSVAVDAATHRTGTSDAYELLVDRLLASPHFGERWGRHWLDVARYADSNGRDRNVYFYHAWRYRDYVIAAFNHDKPFDQFVREQVAGDLLPASTPEQRDEQCIATGFLALGSKAFEESKPEVFRMDVIDEQVELVSRAVLGLSVGCARCHDHKFDPIPTADYYALAGIFRSTQPLYGYGPKGIKSNLHTHTELQPVGSGAAKLSPAGLAYLQRLQELTLVQNTARSDRYRVQRRLSDVKLQLEKPDADQAMLTATIAKLEAEIKEWHVTVKAAEDALQAAMEAAPPQPGWAMGVRDRAAPEDCRIHIRGETTNLGNEVARGMLQVIKLANEKSPSKRQSGRLELAEWLTEGDNPLTARVLVNRIWLQLFGRGLVTTPDDFGVNGARPSHPELLDQLAVRFMEDGWSIKRLVRKLVLSRTYRQSGNRQDELASGTSAGTGIEPAGIGEFATLQVERDPENVYLWRMQPRRLPAEILRDAILSAAGTLDVNGLPPEKSFLAKFNPYREDEYRTFKPIFLPPDLDQANTHRGVYLPVVRGVLPELFQLFDFASPERSVSQREDNTVPAQSLYFLNNGWVIGQARAMATAILADHRLNDAERVTAVYQSALSRAPTDLESSGVLQYLSAPELLAPPSAGNASPTAAELRAERWVSFCQTLFASAEFRYVR